MGRPVLHCPFLPPNSTSLRFSLVLRHLGAEAALQMSDMKLDWQPWERWVHNGRRSKPGRLTEQIFITVHSSGVNSALLHLAQSEGWLSPVLSRTLAMTVRPRGSVPASWVVSVEQPVSHEPPICLCTCSESRPH